MSKLDREPYDKSFARFVRGVGGTGQPKPHVTERPRHDDEAPGPSRFRARAESGSLEELTLPGLFVGRSEVLGRELREVGSALVDPLVERLRGLRVRRMRPHRFGPSCESLRSLHVRAQAQAAAAVWTDDPGPEPPGG